MLSIKNSIAALIVSTLLVTVSVCQAESDSSASAANVEMITIAEIFANKSALKGKMVRVKGKVVKVSRNIMKRNWIHITDGTGEKGSDKIIFRSKTQTAAVDSEVIAQGVVDTDLDFGYGYTYSVLVEDATFSQ
ncbi:MAG: hypothetical protein KZQ64_12410 [gamma proteobacterium symbiont of Bathyaustriella thionipta]|nr:hypothetical protein [gamma proteobacterium symbiont of Bathyaustriella thionipta]MCU7950771.1 hypothetical protein [gamma proteobacterium symbiont of Bathyaustriella thionipta]MCU7954174.1 hypothetical protein [gamma proteobacterium symbiont of Bathyaustriella thionipta]MCU7957287.1 hypothetical protein [gamma proteobacterium symbiont of Bathyaustriella thionipta]MCU7965888.1 hypothetical protein [gamma proteobacterium symbiont of Bathyaustriella thionipta]